MSVSPRLQLVCLWALPVGLVLTFGGMLTAGWLPPPSPRRHGSRGRALLHQGWLGYLGVWAALLYTPSCMVLFFQDGPFAWNGIFTFWLAAGAFVIWNLTLIIRLQRVISATARETERLTEVEPAAI